MKYLLAAAVILTLGLLLTIEKGARMSGSLPEGYNFGAEGGKLAPCRSTPNCVSSQARDRLHYIEPVKMNGTAEEEKKKLLEIVRSMPGSKIIEDRKNYVRAEFRSRIFRFVDDVEFYFDEGSRVIHVRSGARMGRGDFGVNRKRVERIRSLLGA